MGEENGMFTRRAAAQRLGINFETLRYYEKIGILEEPQRGANGYRLYSVEEIATLELVAEMKNCGFSLAEIREFLVMLKSGKGTEAGLKAGVAEKMAFICEKISELEKINLRLQRIYDHIDEGECERMRAVKRNMKIDKKEKKLKKVSGSY